MSFWSDFAQLIVGSGSAPGFFPPQKVFDTLWADGGAAYNLELPSLVDFCRDKGYSDDRISIDVILLSPTKEISRWEKTGRTAVTNYWRSRQISQGRKTNEVLSAFMRANPNINYRYLVKPDSKLIREYNLVDFQPKRSRKLIEEGREEAERVVSSG